MTVGRETLRRNLDGSLRRLLLTGCVALAALSLPLGVALAQDDLDQVSESSPETLGELDAEAEKAEHKALEGLPSPAVPAGAMSAEGVVPLDGEAGATAGTVVLDPTEQAEISVAECKKGVYGDPPLSGCGDPEERPWRYDTRYIFGLTRGLTDEAGVSAKGWPWIAPMTIPIDFAFLPFAALSGLSGS